MVRLALSTKHGLCDPYIRYVCLSGYDVVNQMLMFGFRMHPRGLAVWLTKHSVGYHKVMFRSGPKK